MSALRDELRDHGGDITTALEDVLLPACLLDTDGIIRWQNRTSLAFRGSVVGCSFVELVFPAEQHEARWLIRRILSRAEPAELTLPFLTAAGRYTPIQLSAAPVRDGTTVVGIFGLARTGPPRRVRSSRVDRKLTGRQHEILRLLAEGRSTGEIAGFLTLSPTTVRNHIAKILTALRVHTRLQAVLTAIRTGLLDP